MQPRELMVPFQNICPAAAKTALETTTPTTTSTTVTTATRRIALEQFQQIELTVGSLDTKF